jgi:hypothetical protein
VLAPVLVIHLFVTDRRTKMRLGNETMHVERSSTAVADNEHAGIPINRANRIQMAVRRSTHPT